jgi:hypothetical protein
LFEESVAACGNDEVAAARGVGDAQALQPGVDGRGREEAVLDVNDPPAVGGIEPDLARGDVDTDAVAVVKGGGRRDGG